MQDKTALRVVFAGTPDFAASYLEALIEGGHEIVGVYTQPDRPAGRGKKLTPSPVKQLAIEHSLPVYQPHSLKDSAAQQELADLKPDVMVVVAYGQILPQAVLDIPRFGCLNIHASLLPRWRGAAPIQRALEAGDAETGIAVMQMDAGLDTGDILMESRCPILPDDTSASLFEKLSQLGREPLLEVLADLPKYQAQAQPQDESGVTYAHKISKDEARLDWSRSAAELERQVRAFNPFPAAWAELAGVRIKVFASELLDEEPEVTPGTITDVSDAGITVRCGQGSLRLTQLQLPGKRAMPVKDILLGNRQLFTEAGQFTL